MNRSIVIFVALAILLAHSLAIRTDTAGDLAPPYDHAFVAFRVARNLVFEGQWSWAPGQTGIDSYPSTLWVLICAAAERTYIPINTFARFVGVIASASSFFMATRFQAERTASLITPMLLAISGATAAAAVSGTETALFTALVTASFLAYERRHDRILGLCLMLCGWTRGEGWILALAFLGLRLYDRGRSRGTDEPTGSLRPFLAPAIGALALAVLRFRLTGHVESPFWRDLYDLRPGEIANGVAYVRDFFVSSVSPALILYCVWYFFRRNLSRTGKRALVIFLVWTGTVVIAGGGQTPLSESMVPILPITFIAGQEGLITALNSTKAPVRGFAWFSFLVAVVASTLASFRPNDLGPIPMERLQREWMSPTAKARFGFADNLGRPGLDEEAGATRFLRDVAIFLRDEVDPRRTVMTPWPGSIAYISSLPVIDVLGRATPSPMLGRTTHAPLQPRVDILAALDLTPDYIVPYWRPLQTTPTTAALAREWHANLDLEGADPTRLTQVEAALDEYEWITIPLRRPAGESMAYFRDHAYILRRRSLGLSPRLRVGFENRMLRVELEHRGHLQLGDLSVRARLEGGAALNLNPGGGFVEEWVLARPNLLLSETGERSLLLLEVPIRRSAEELQSLEVNLLNPGWTNGGDLPRIAAEVVVRVP